MPTVYYVAQSNGTWTAPGRMPLIGGDRSSLVPGTYEPGLDTTGVIPGVNLLTVSGNLIITAPGLYENLDVHGQVIVRAPNVILKNSRARGILSNANLGLIDCTHAAVVNFQAIDCTLIPDFPSYGWNAIIGHDFNLLRCQWMHTVDGYRGYRIDLPAAALNISVIACWGGAYSFFSPDPNHSNDDRVHSDGGQIETGLAKNHSVSSPASWLTPLSSIADASVIVQFNAFHGWYAGGYLFPDRWTGFNPVTSNPLSNPPNVKFGLDLRDSTTSILQVTPSQGVPVTGIWFEGNLCYGGGVGVSLAGGGGSGKRCIGRFITNVFDGEQRQGNGIVSNAGTANAWCFSIKSPEYGDRDVPELLGVFTGNTNEATDGAARLGRVT